MFSFTWFAVVFVFFLVVGLLADAESGQRAAAQLERFRLQPTRWEDAIVPMGKRPVVLSALLGGLIVGFLVPVLAGGGL